LIKKITYQLFLIAIVLLVAYNAKAQQQTNLVKKQIATKIDSLLLDTLSIVPNTFSITNLPAHYYQIDYINSKLVFLQKPDTDSVAVTYRTFPYHFNKNLQLYNYEEVKNNFQVTPFRPYSIKNASKLIDLGKIEYTGSFGRELSFGNAQDAVLNSNLNLQLSGMLADSIEIAASITDQNLPIQPDGSTTQLNEIDRMYIQFKKRNWQLTAGDIDLRQNNHYYLNFYKRLQGATYENKINISKNIKSNVMLSGAMARGKFTSNTFQGLEGNQGPYRLQGANNEFFFIVLAGTERVFVDGEIMQRGEDQDYIINYNTAEITFTPKMLITKDKRIRVEFEYSDRNYVNTQLYASNQMAIGKKLKLGISYFSNSDSKNAPVNIELNNLQKQFLGLIGDSVQNAFYATVQKDTLSAGKILYQLKDTTVNSILYSIYKYSNDPDSAKFSLGFAELGIGKGNYQVLLNGANGKVYQWIAPINGIKQGSYEPVEFLVAPKKQQIVVLQSDYTINANNNVNVEIALSKNDINTFSSKDKKNDDGLAAKIKYNNTNYITKKSKLESSIAVERNDNKFKTIERLRTPEFNRDWNILNPLEFYNEMLSTAAINFVSQKNNNIKIQATNFTRGEDYNGNRLFASSNYNIKGWLLNATISNTNTNDLLQKGFFIRPTVTIQKSLTKLKNYKLSFTYFSDRNELTNKVGDSLNPISIAFDSYKTSISSDEKLKNKWSLGYTYRNNKIPTYKTLTLSDQAQDWEALLGLNKNPNRMLNVKATFRNLEVKLPQRVNYKSDKTLLGRVEYNFLEWKSLVQGSLLFESGSGQEQRRDFAYLQVPAGQGEYFWQDYNGDGIQQLNEFEIAQFRDQRQFIKIFVPTNQYIKANFNNFNYNLQINPKAILRNAKYKGFNNLLSRMFFKSNFQISKKEISNNVINGNPFKLNKNDTSLISLSRAFSNTFSFNKFSNVWGVDFNHDYRSGKSLLTYGYETRDVNTYSVKVKWNIAKNVLTELGAKNSQNKLSTPTFGNRNYDINTKGLENRVSYVYKNKFRMESTILAENQNNSNLYGGEKANTKSISLESKYNVLQKAALLGKFTYTNIAFTGTANTTTSFIMLNALLPGKNYLWNIDLIKTLKNNLEITLRYEGRKTETSKTVHIGTATMRANFY
jgi:hypothetical protein